jgi:2,4-dienoyl-CoA reductase-like NADH-dependent reductase (Old Yellow Enzyme family)
VNKTPKAPSAVPVNISGGQFGQPIALTVEEIMDIVKRFATCAKACKDAGFTGVQVHSAHGYLLSQFLSPRSNLREDKYGGGLENRARALLEVVSAIRAAVGPEFPICVKLNSADFQKGGFAFDDSVIVAKWLEAASVDIIEISGGTYEQPKLIGVAGVEPVEEQNAKVSTSLREAYFVDFAMAMQEHVSIPLMVTGGFRQLAAMEEAVTRGGADMIGIGRPMCVVTDAPNRLLAGQSELPRYEGQLSLFPKWLTFLAKLKPFWALATFGVQFWYYAQLELLGTTGKANEALTPFQATKRIQEFEKQWLSER